MAAMDSIYPWKLLSRRMLALMAFYFAYRVIFLVANWSAFSTDSGLDVTWAVVHGLRFDLWAVLWGSLPVIVSAFLPSRLQGQRWLQKSLFVYVILASFIGLGLNIIDVELFKFTGQRLTMAWLKLQQDVQAQSWSLVTYYWKLALVGLSVWGLFLWGWPRWQMPCERTRSPWLSWSLPALVALMVVVGLRGGLQLKPLNLNHAFERGSAALGALTLNSTFAFFKNRRSVTSLKVRFFTEPIEVKNLLSELHQPTSTLHGRFKDWNVVLILVESLGTEYMGTFNQGKGHTPFLDELARASWVFPNNFANGRRSIEAIPSLLCGFPSLMGEALLVSSYQGIELHCLGNYLKAQGYHTSFFHGAYNGSMHFDTFSQRAGFERYFGFNEYDNSADSDGFWGIFDEPFLQYTQRELSQTKEPFFATIFTLSSHHPYRLPKGYENRFPKGEAEIHQSIAYTDYALKEFFAAVEKQPWFNKTIFILTGDHTHKSTDSRYQNLLGYYRVPLLIYVPGMSGGRAAVPRLTQHVDVLPTVADLLGLELKPQLQFGQSVFAAHPGVAFNGDGRAHWLLTSNWVVEYVHGSEDFLFYPVSTALQVGSPVPPDASAQQAKEWLKAVVHYFNTGVVTNSLYHF